MSDSPFPQPEPGELPTVLPLPDDGVVPAVTLPRPTVLSASLLIIAGAVMVVAGAMLPWLQDGSYELSGNRTFWGRQNEGWREVTAPGRFMIVLAVVVGIVGIVLLVMNRVVAVAVLGVIMSTISFFFNLACLSVVNDTQEKLGAGRIGAGVPVAIAGAAAALIGSISATAKRRRAVVE